MSDPQRPDPHLSVATALSALGTAVRRTAAPPPAAAIRARAEHQQRVRRTGATVLAAAAVIAVVVGGVNLVRDSALPTPPPPASSSTPTPGPTAGPRPTKSVPPWPAPKVDDPIARVDWTKARITLPRHTGCPSGTVQFGPERAGSELVAGPKSYPRVWLDNRRVSYGDLTGDGRPEAVLSALCVTGAEDSGDGEGQLLVVQRDGNSLNALGWVGPRGAIYAGFWVAGGELLADAHQWHTNFGYRLGLVLAHRWQGAKFVRVDRSAQFLPLEGAAGAAGPDVDLTGVAGRSGCPAARLKFPAGGRMSAAGTTWDLDQPSTPNDLQNWVDLAGDGRRRLLVTITCGRPADGEGGTTFLAVLEPTSAAAYRAIDVVRVDLDQVGAVLGRWEYREGQLSVTIQRPDGSGEGWPYTWNGEYFQR